MEKRDRIYVTKYYIRFITYLVFTVFIRYYRIKRILPSDVARLKSPYLLLGNHVGYWDPFIIGHLLPRFTHFVASDAAFKSAISGFFLSRLGTIPKKKNLRDTQVIRDIARVLKQGDNVGLFPEGVRNWAGTSLPIDPSIAKLVKFLKVPVVISLSRGMNLFNPRWSRKVRRTRVEVEYKLLLQVEDIVRYSLEDIYQRIVDALYHDEVDHQRTRRHVIKTNKRAENISHALFICPRCHSIDTFKAKGNDFQCTTCNYLIHINKFGFFEIKLGTDFYFDNIRDWYNWQEAWMFTHIRKLYEKKYSGVIFQDDDSAVYFSESTGDLTFIGKADLYLYLDRIEIRLRSHKETRILTIEDLLTINPQVHEKVEIFCPGVRYRFVEGRPGVSGLKWEVAVNAIWFLLGQKQKLSPYIRIYSE